MIKITAAILLCLAWIYGVGYLLAAADLWADIDGEAREDYVDRMRGGGA